MKLWKSPVLYIGVLLVLALIAALAAPFVVNWDSYRADLEGYGRKLTGREVTISGSISASLFPWPSLTVENVHVANPPGMNDPEFAEAARITARMQLGGLLNGDLRVESIEIDQPTITFERQPEGQGNWNFQSEANLNDVLDRVKLDRVTLTDATVRLIDRRRAPGVIELRMRAVSLASPGITGPWRLTADQVETAGQNFALSLSTSTWTADQPLQFFLRVSGVGGTGLAYSFDGAAEKEKVTGVFEILPASEEETNADAKGQLRALAFRSSMTATFDAVAFDAIAIGPRDPKDGATIATGSARLALGSSIKAEVDLTAPRIELETLTGAAAYQVLRESGQLTLVDSFLAILPEGVELTAAFKVGTLKAGGETFENMTLRGEASHEVIRIRELSASLPGRSRALFQDAVFFPGKVGSEIAGKLAFESSDLKAFTTWAWPEAKASIAQVWTGSRGRLKFQTDLSLSTSELKLARTEYEIDGLPGTVDFSVALGGKGAIDLRIAAEKLDIDTYAPNGIQAASGQDQSGLATLLGYIAPTKDSRDLALTMQAGELLLNGVTASDVAVDLVSAANGLDLRTLEIGSVGGAKLDAVGLILDTGSGPDGTINVTVEARDPRGMLRLFGVVPANVDPKWTTVLGATKLKGSINVKTEATGPVTGFDIAGTSGGFELAALGNVASAPSFETMEMGGTINLKSASSAKLALLAGLDPVTESKEPSSFSVTASGSLAKGFLAEINVEAYGAQLDYDGTVGIGGRWLPGDGKVSLRSTEIELLLGAMGLPQATLPSGSLVLDADVKTDGATLTLPAIEGHFGENDVTGNLTRAGDGRLAVALSTQSADLRDLLGAVYLNWNGLAPEPESGFAATTPLNLSGELRLDLASLRISDEVEVPKAKIVITAAPGETRVSMSAAAEAPRLDITARGDGKRIINGALRMPFDLAKNLNLAGGNPVAEGKGWIDVEFQGEGRSPGAALSALKGKGAYSVKDLKLVSISAPEFGMKLEEAKDGAGLNAAFDALRSAESGLLGGDVEGTIAIENGAMVFSPVAIAAPEADATVSFSVEPAVGAVDAKVKLKLKQQADWPEVTIIYAGPAKALARNEDKTELATLLGNAIMSRGVEELVRLQAEEKRLADEQEKIRAEDEAKLVAYYAQRDELRLRARELKVHAEMRAAAAAEIRVKIEAERQINTAISVAELKQRQRELRVHRRVAKERPKPEPVKIPPLPFTQQPVEQ